MTLTATTTGSKSARLTWDPTLAPASSFQVYRGTTSVFGAASAVGSPQVPGTAVYNDYGPLTPATAYYYWIKDAGAPTGPVPTTTLAAVVDADALGETQMDALYDWAFNALGGLYPVEWRYQPTIQPIKPKAILNVLLVRSPGISDDRRDMGESLVGARIGTVSVAVSTDAQPPMRALAGPSSLVTGNYTLTVNGSAVTVALTSPATYTEVSTAMLAALTAAGYSGFLYGSDPTAQSIAFESPDPRGDFTVVAGVNMSASTYTPPKAMTLAQRLVNSLQIPSLRDALSLAGIGVGTVNDPNDVSVGLETRFELRAQFDFYINVASVLGISGPIIDTVSSVDGTITP